MSRKQLNNAPTTQACITIPIRLHEEMKDVQQAMIDAECDNTITLSRVYRKAAELYVHAKSQQKLVQEWSKKMELPKQAGTALRKAHDICRREASR